MTNPVTLRGATHIRRAPQRTEPFLSPLAAAGPAADVSVPAPALSFPAPCPVDRFQPGGGPLCPVGAVTLSPSARCIPVGLL